MDLADWMDKNEISDEELAGAIGSTRSYISRIRRGKVQPNLELALRIWEHSAREADLDSMLPDYLRGEYQRRWMPDSVQKPAARRASKSRASA